MIRRPPRSTRTDTLFPYTTLFRSQSSFAMTTCENLNQIRTHGESAFIAGKLYSENPHPIRSPERLAWSEGHDAAREAHLRRLSEQLDRKSTRLNSSH